ncbi:MAG: 1-(5-phosphoribosyl)-5-[(5-phosphoribosylamino)methylideneamino]imidazole-4-carboxamide isomerase [Candidatus Hydrogenedentes bacterium]|nr:1-(5-phosphoribosyl)-5-[(5-phosphoribosylamino)methylideneamino]imidazole-4-carboxamide isomerase [Candidatus Hydrogenedentota bacterium]
MRIVPAVDIRGGLCVNLVQGDYDRETVFSDDPVAQAVKWHDVGGVLIHIVDLDGAKAGRCCIEGQLREIAGAGVPFEVGGGIRNMETVHTVIEAGARRVILGTAAHRDPDLLARAAAEFPGRIVAGIDGRRGKVALSGWCETTQTDVVEFARRVEGAGAARIIFTDISSDGMMGGADVETTRSVARSVRIPVTASGGISSLDDVRALKRVERDGIDEIIIGRALYLEKFTLPEAISAAGEAS